MAPGRQRCRSFSFFSSSSSPSCSSKVQIGPKFPLLLILMWFDATEQAVLFWLFDVLHNRLSLEMGGAELPIMVVTPPPCNLPSALTTSSANLLCTR